MSQPLGPPVIIPEEGLNVPPAVWQVVFILTAPLLAGAALILPIALITLVVSTVILEVWKLFDPPGYNPPLLYPKDQSNEET